MIDLVERAARWLLPDDLTEGELLFFTFIALTCGLLVALVAV